MPAKIKRPKPRKVWARTPTAHRDRARAAGFPPFQTMAKRVWLPLGGTGVSTGSLRLARLILTIAIRVSIVPGAWDFSPVATRDRSNRPDSTPLPTAEQ